MALCIPRNQNQLRIWAHEPLEVLGVCVFVAVVAGGLSEQINCCGRIEERVGKIMLDAVAVVIAKSVTLRTWPLLELLWD